MASLNAAVRNFRARGQLPATRGVSVKVLLQRFSPGMRSVRSLFAPSNAPRGLQFRLRGFVESEATDDTFQGAGDEVFMSALGLDSSAVIKGADGKPVAGLIEAPRVGDVSDNAVRNQWRTNPHVLLEFDLSRAGDWPRTYTATLLIVEEDNARLGEAFAKLKSEVGGKLRRTAVAAASTAAGALAGAAIGSAIPGIGTAVGAAVGALAGAAYDEIVDQVQRGLGNEIFKPRSLVLTVPNPTAIPSLPEVGREQTLRVQEHGADYRILYDWHIVD